MTLLQDIRNDSVADLAPVEPAVVGIEATVRQAVAEMQQHRHGAVIVEREGRMAGIFSERDLLKKILRPKRSLDTPVAEVMTPGPKAVRRETPVTDALRMFHQGGFRHLPVVDEEMRPTGMLSIKFLVNYLVELYPGAIYNLPPEPGKISTEVDGG